MTSFVHKSACGVGAEYLTELVIQRVRCQSGDELLLLIPRTKIKTYAVYSFSVKWNSLQNVFWQIQNCWLL